MGGYSQLLELRDELTFLKRMFAALSTEEIFSDRHRRAARRRDIRQRMRRIRIAIRVHEQLSSWRKENVYVVARSRQDATRLFKCIGWPTRQEALEHLQIVRVFDWWDWTFTVSYRVFKLKRFRRVNKEEFVATLMLK